MKFKSQEEIKSALIKIAEDMGIEIISIETKISKNPYLTIYIDTESGVDLNTCELFHNKIDPILDEIDVSFGDSYTLNVSSPGLDRSFQTDRDFERNIGKMVEIKLYAPLQGKKYFECKLVGYDGKNVVLIEDNKEFKIPLNRIAKINQAIIFN